MAKDIVGRTEELASIEAFLDRVQDGPGALVLSGEAGIGKTILWEVGVEEANRRFGRVLICRAAEAEASLSFAGLSELLTPVLEEVTHSLAPPRRRALEIALLLIEPGEDAPDVHAIGLALLDTLHLLAERGPVLVALDDLQWLDSSSAAVLQIALRRLRDTPVGLLGTLRMAPETNVPFQLDCSFPEERLSRLSLGPLTIAALHDILKQRHGLELTRPELVRVQDATAGNPFFALELGRELVRTNTRPVAGQALRVPASLHELLGGRLARLPAETVDVLLQVAALARPTVELVATVHGDRERVLGAVEAAVREGVIEFDDSRLRFVHPLLASICYEQAPVWKRRAVHRALASAVSDIEEQARQLALAVDGPDAVAASCLAAASEQAAARGATAAAAELSELAGVLTPDDPVLSRERRLRAAGFHRLAGDRDLAAVLLGELLTEVPPGVERADVLFALANTVRADPPTMIERCGEALEEAPGDDARSARILALRSLFRLLAADVPGALVDARAALGKAERVGDSALLAVVIARVGQAETWGAEITPGLLERGAEIEESLGFALEFIDSPRAFLSRLLMRLGELDRARTILGELEAEATARGDEGSRVLVMWYLTLLEWFSGRWSQAFDLASRAGEFEQSQVAHNPAWAGRIKGTVEADLGLVDEARASAEEGLAFSRARSDEFFTIVCLGVLGRLELSLGNLEAAGAYLRELPERLLAGGVKDPINPIWADTIETLISLGEVGRARTYLEQYELHARQLGSPWALAAAARCRGLLEAADGDLEGAFGAFERALAELDEHPYPFERGRSLLALGTARRRAQRKRSARDALEQALAIFEELGARLWADKARAELRRISGRRAPSGVLTETESRVASLAAQGRSNKEIAAELYMGVSTVEAHLSHVYRKLGVRRAELATRLAVPMKEVPQVKAP